MKTLRQFIEELEALAKEHGDQVFVDAYNGAGDSGEAYARFNPASYGWKTDSSRGPRAAIEIDAT